MGKLEKKLLGAALIIAVPFFLWILPALEEMGIDLAGVFSQALAWWPGIAP